MNVIKVNNEQTETLWKRARDSGMTRRKFLVLLASSGAMFLATLLLALSCQGPVV
ncbi:MAG: hypothetical protein HYY41_07360, partial [Chloroflexi bacterium]|nr:hypothetical protein [Chloroflexota bacterium]